MRNLMHHADYAGKTWEASTSGRKYDVDAHGVVNILDDDEHRGTKDRSEADAAGFKPWSPGEKVKLVNKDFGKRKVRFEPVPGDIHVKDAGPDAWSSKTGHHYQADDAGMIEVFACDVDEAKAAGFTAS